MILQSVRLHPFAGIADKTYSFNPDLTIICGPNEEGKSTVAKAIQQALFLETNLTPARKRDYLKDVMPVTGGDTICVTLGFSWNGYQFTLEKKWGATASVQLRRSDGLTLTDNSAVQQQIQDMLPANRAVVEQILISSQSKLADAVSHLSTDVQSSLSEKLRAAIINGGGISATRLEQMINQDADNYFGRWDEAAGRPEGGPGRGLANPWRNGVGRVTGAWYEWEQARVSEKETANYEIESNRLQTELNKCNKELNELSEFLGINKAAYDAVNQRIAIEGDLQKYCNELEHFAADAQRWPVAIIEKSSTETAFNGVEADLKELRIELDQAREKLSAQRDLSKLSQVNDLKKKKEEAERALSTLTEIPEADVSLARGCQQEVMQCQSVIQGQRLRFVINASVPGQIDAMHSGGQSEVISFGPNQNIEKGVSGGIHFEWQGVSFTVQSANENITTLEASLDSAQTALRSILEKYELSTVEALSNAAKEYEEASRHLQQAQSNLVLALGNDTVESLQSRCEAASALPGTRDLNVLERLMQEKTQLKGACYAKIDTLSREIQTLEKKHGSQQDLTKRQLQGLMVSEQKEKELKLLPALPEGYTSAAAFQEEYNSVQGQKQEKSEAKHKLEMDLQALKIPKLPLHEAKEQTILAERRFQQTLAEGKAYRRIQEALQDLLSQADRNAFQPLHARTEAYLSRLSSGRFQRIPFDVTLPQQLEGNGVALPVTLLSKGTKDILALALRLAAAEVYLQNHSGFVMMDDPLVDMDRKRRMTSAAVLKEFAKSHQTIIFTCHEAHEALLQNQQAVSVPE